MWAAPAVAKRSLLALLAATVTLCFAVPVASAKIDVSQSAAAVPGEIWAVEVDRTSIPLLDESFAELLEFGQVNTLIVDSRRVTRRQFERVRAFAVKSQLTLVSPHARTPTSKKKLKSGVARTVGACRALARRSTTEPCVVLARTRAAAFALTSRSEVDVVLTRVSGPADVRTLNRELSRRVTAARIIALPPLRGEYSFRRQTWSRAVDAAAYSLALDVAPSLTSARWPTLLRVGLVRYFQVVNDSRQARLLNSAPTPPAPPSGLSVKSAASHSLTVTWSPAAPTDGVVGYLLHVNDSRAGVTALRTATISGLSCGTTHRVALVAANRIGNQSSRANLSASTAACGSRPAPAPQPTPAPTPAPQFAPQPVPQPSHPTAPAPPPISSPIAPPLAPAPPVTPAPAPAPAPAPTAPGPSPPPSSIGQAYVSPSGSDANPCTAAQPCLTFNRAYKAVTPGGVVQVASGTYPGQVLEEDSSKMSSTHVTFQPSSGGVTIQGSLDFGQDQFKKSSARHVTVRNMTVVGEIRGWSTAEDLVWEGMTATNFMIDGGRNITVAGGVYGQCLAIERRSCVSKVAGTGAANIVMDGVTFRDVTSSNPVLYHPECLFLRSGKNVTIRRSRFYNCESFDIFLQGQPEISGFSGITIENNWFDAALKADGGRRDTAISFSSGNFSNVLIRYNSFFEAGILFKDSASYSDVRVAANIMKSTSCPGGVRFGYNVFATSTCGDATNKSLSGGGYPYAAPVFGPGGNYTLLSTSVARDFVPASEPDFALGTDFAGGSRPKGAARDAGSTEVG